jgi:hypothetical protein
MEIVIQRRWADGDATIGELSVDGSIECYTLEDEVRDGDIFTVKVAGATAIPAGRYQVIVTRSTRFGRDLPLLLKVPNFEGIRIHPGNTAANTEGCILVGMKRGAARVDDSRTAFDALFPKIQAALAAGEACWITLQNDFEVTA